MKPLLLLAASVTLVFSAPGLAKPGMGQGNGHAFGFGIGHGLAHATGRGGMHGRAFDGPIGYGVGGCPPGLARKSVPCMPPGQARKLGLGSRVPRGYDLLSYSSLPRAVRSRHDLNASGRYVYNKGGLYEVNPRSRTVTRVIRAR